MKCKNGVKKLYFKIQKDLISLVPEHWESILLYASVIDGARGEMYFFYYPKKIIKSKPVNCYEVPSKFGIDETMYYARLKKLYQRIKELNTYSFPRWTNITIIIKNNIFTIECKYNDLLKSKYSDEERRILWSFKYLNTPIESMSLREKALIQTYNEDVEVKPTVYSEFIGAEATVKNNNDNREFEEQNELDEQYELYYEYQSDDEYEEKEIVKNKNFDKKDDDKAIKNRILKY